MTSAAAEQGGPQPGSLTWAVGRLLGLIGADADPGWIAGFVHFGPPGSKARARYSKKSRRFYTPDRTASQEEALAWKFRSQMRGRATIRGNVALLAVFYRPNYQRIDADNLLKLVLDAGTRARAWEDDCQVTTQGAIIEYDPHSPRTIITFCDCPSSLDRSVDRHARPCAHCRNPFTPSDFSRAKTQRYCSPACAARSRGQDLSEPVLCPQCGEPFRRRTSAQKFCSVSCARLSRTGKKRPDGSPALCIDCKKPVKNRNAKRCRSCWKKARSRWIA